MDLRTIQDLAPRANSSGAYHILAGESDDESKITLVVAINVGFIVFTSLIMGLRIYTRFAMRVLGYDDALILCATFITFAASATILFALHNRLDYIFPGDSTRLSKPTAMINTRRAECKLIMATNHGLGRHVWTVSRDDIREYRKSLITCSILYNAATALIKISICALYLRLSASILFQRVTKGVIITITIIAFVSNIVLLFQCTPIQYAWDKSIPGGKCLRLAEFYYANAALNITTNLAVYLLPMPMLWGTNMPKRQKYGLCGIFGLGGFACISSIVRLLHLKDLFTVGDQTWTVVSAIDWSLIELHTAIFAATIPTFKILYNMYYPRTSSFERGEFVSDPPATSYTRRGPGHSYALTSVQREPDLPQFHRPTSTKRKREVAESSSEEMIMPVMGCGEGMTQGSTITVATDKDLDDILSAKSSL